MQFVRQTSSFMIKKEIIILTLPKLKMHMLGVKIKLRP
jgi:hypothetical protein